MAIIDHEAPSVASREDQREALRRWQEAELSPNTYKPRSGGRPPEFRGDWSGDAWATGPLDLRGADLRGASSMDGARLAGADLRGARLDGVTLQGADLKGARLDGAIFRDADLRDASFQAATGLSIEALAGADLSSADLPADLGAFTQLEGVSEAAKSTQSVYRLLLLVCGFATLTAMSVRDENLVLRDGQSLTQLPLLQAEVSPQVFAYVMPVLILLLYGYQSLYTVSLWRLYSFLPAYFPDGAPLDRKSYPSMTNIFVRYSLRRIKNERNDDLSFLLHWFITFGMPPLTLIVVWLAGLKKHDAMLSFAQALMLGLAVFLSAFMLALSGSILRNEWKIKDVSLARFFLDMPRCLTLVGAVAIVAMVWAASPAVRRIVPDVFLLGMLGAIVVLGFGDVAACVKRRDYAPATSSLFLVCLALALTLQCIALSAFGGKNYDLKVIEVEERRGGVTVDREFPVVGNPSPLLRFLTQTRLNPFLDFRNKVVSKRPADWKGQGMVENDQIELVVGADMEAADLRSMDAERAFLARANFRGADLRGAYLRFAYLREADLGGARLDGAYLRGANLRDANLHRVDLGKVILSSDRKDPTKFIGPNFQGVRVNFKDWEPTIVATLVEEQVNNLALVYYGISAAELADDPNHPVLGALKTHGLPLLTDKELSTKQLAKPTTFPASLPMESADLSGFILRGCSFDKVDLGSAMFVGADVTGASFRGADLAAADFTDAKLGGADFTGANVAGAVFTHSTWFKAKGLEAQRDLIIAVEGHLPLDGDPAGKSDAAPPPRP